MAEKGASSPELFWGNAPEGTVEYMIAMTSDTPDGLSYSWFVFNISAGMNWLPPY